MLQAVLQERNLQSTRRFEERTEARQRQPGQQQRQRSAGRGLPRQQNMRLAVMETLRDLGLDESALTALQGRGGAPPHDTRPAGARLVPGRDGRLLRDFQCWQCQQWGHRRHACPGAGQGNG